MQRRRFTSISGRGCRWEDLGRPLEAIPEAYISVAVDEVPKYFTMPGPNSGVASGGLTEILESTGDNITKCIHKLQKEDIKSVRVSSHATASWVKYVETYLLSEDRIPRRLPHAVQEGQSDHRPMAWQYPSRHQGFAIPEMERLQEQLW